MLVLLVIYQAHSYLILPFLGIAWGCVYMAWLNDRKRAGGLGIVGAWREAYVVANVGRPPWYRLYLEK